MRLFKRLFSSLLIKHKNNNNMLGRWNIHYEEHIINKKVEQANEDHCGVCISNNLEKKQLFYNDNDNDEEYYKVFIM